MSEYRQHTEHLWDLEPHYATHVSAMTTENLWLKSEIAAELAVRDKRIAELQAMLRSVLQSATPHPTEHPTMWKAWGEASVLLGEPADKRRLR
jgi:hypothetical protein